MDSDLFIAVGSGYANSCAGQWRTSLMHSLVSPAEVGPSINNAMLPAV